MKKILQILLILFILILGYWIYYYSGLDQILIQLILINIIIYIFRTILIRLNDALIKNKIIKFGFTTTVNIIWIIFLFSLMFYLSPIYTISIISFLVVAISLTFRDLISNVASGIMVLTSQMIEPGDLIETNGVEGIVEEITLNYTKIREFDGVINFIPNSNIFNSSITKYTHKQLKNIDFSISDTENFSKKEKMKKYAEKMKEIIESEKKITSYVKTVELTGSVDPVMLEKQLDALFDKYEKILGLRPTYNIDNTVADRLQVSLRINSESPKLVLENTDLFLRDLLFRVNFKEVFEGWSGQEIS